jgi:DNA-binding SARP family transcriptional activator
VSSAKERLLLAVLVVHANEVASTDRLIEVLWGASRLMQSGRGRRR